jgi:hypothetical protein
MSVGDLVSRASAILCPHEDFIRYAMPSSKLCVLKGFLGSDCISYTLAFHVDVSGKLHPGAIHCDGCCGENCVDDRGAVQHNRSLICWVVASILMANWIRNNGVSLDAHGNA